MFKHSLIILKNALIVSTVFLAFDILAMGLSSPSPACYGIDCQEITCPDGYMIKVQEDKYVPCEELEKHLEER